MTTEEIKAFIMGYLVTLGDRITPTASASPKEYPLRAFGSFYYADLAYLIDRDKWLFIEIDDAQTSQHNASKYWPWIDQNRITTPIHLVHLVGSSYPTYVQLARFLTEKMHSDHANFKYYQALANSWEDLTWQKEFKTVIAAVLQS